MFLTFYIIRGGVLELKEPLNVAMPLSYLEAVYGSYLIVFLYLSGMKVSALILWFVLLPIFNAV